jgi:hypothetical protein
MPATKLLSDTHRGRSNTRHRDMRRPHGTSRSYSRSRSRHSASGSRSSSSSSDDSRRNVRSHERTANRYTATSSAPSGSSTNPVYERLREDRAYVRAQEAQLWSHKVQAMSDFDESCRALETQLRLIYKLHKALKSDPTNKQLSDTLATETVNHDIECKKCDRVELEVQDIDRMLKIVAKQDARMSSSMQATLLQLNVNDQSDGEETYVADYNSTSTHALTTVPPPQVYAAATNYNGSSSSQLYNAVMPQAALLPVDDQVSHKHEQGHSSYVIPAKTFTKFDPLTTSSLIYVDRFEQELQPYAHIYGVQDQKAALFINACEFNRTVGLTKRRTQPDGSVVDIPIRQLSYEEMILCLKHRHEGDTAIHKARMEFKQATMLPSETPLSLDTRLRQLAKAGGRDLEQDTALKEQFIQALPKNLRERVQEEDCPTLTAALERAERLFNSTQSTAAWFSTEGHASTHRSAAHAAAAQADTAQPDTANSAPLSTPRVDEATARQQVAARLDMDPHALHELQANLRRHNQCYWCDGCLTQGFLNHKKYCKHSKVAKELQRMRSHKAPAVPEHADHAEYANDRASAKRQKKKAKSQDQQDRRNDRSSSHDRRRSRTPSPVKKAPEDINKLMQQVSQLAATQAAKQVMKASRLEPVRKPERTSQSKRSSQYRPTAHRSSSRQHRSRSRSRDDDRHSYRGSRSKARSASPRNTRRH